MRRLSFSRVRTLTSLLVAAKSQFFQFTYRIPLLMYPIPLHLFTIQTAVGSKYWASSARKFVLPPNLDRPIQYWDKASLPTLVVFRGQLHPLWCHIYFQDFTAAEIQWQTILQRGNSTPTTQSKITQGSFKPIGKATQTSPGMFRARWKCEHLIKLLGARCGGNLTRVQTIEPSSL